jgi:hypothetical protein
MESQTLGILLLAAHLIIGVILCFFGNRWLKAIVAVYGFAVGFMLAHTLLPVVTQLSDTPVLLVSIGAGIAGAVLFVLLIYVGIFFIGFGAGITLCLLIIRAFGFNMLDWYVYIPAMVIASIFGSLTLNWRRIFIAIFTAFIGASALAQFVYQVWNGLQPATLASYYGQEATYEAYTSAVYLVALGVLFVGGLIVQLAITKKEPKRK